MTKPEKEFLHPDIKIELINLIVDLNSMNKHLRRLRGLGIIFELKKDKKEEEGVFRFKSNSRACADHSRLVEFDPDLI